jgi:hypothetical protein
MIATTGDFRFGLRAGCDDWLGLTGLRALTAEHMTTFLYDFEAGRQAPNKKAPSESGGA